MPHELRGIERMPVSGYGYVLLMTLLGVVLALFIRYLSRKQGKKRNDARKVKLTARKGTRVRKRR